MPWMVDVNKKVQKQYPTLPKTVKESLFTLLFEMEVAGPVRGNWPNYGKLGRGRHHCHIKKGHPTYVAVWEEVPGREDYIEVIYAGTHEGAPY